MSSQMANDPIADRAFMTALGRYAQARSRATTLWAFAALFLINTAASAAFIWPVAVASAVIALIFIGFASYYEYQAKQAKKEMSPVPEYEPERQELSVDFSSSATFTPAHHSHHVHWRSHDSIRTISARRTVEDESSLRPRQA